MKINISLTSEKPMYEQIEDCIRQSVLSGELENNHPMPSVRQLAADINVSTITVKRAYADLERDGILYTVSGKGTYVRLDNMELLQNRRQMELLSVFEEDASALKEAGVQKERLIETVQKIYEKG